MIKTAELLGCIFNISFGKFLIQTQLLARIYQYFGISLGSNVILNESNFCNQPNSIRIGSNSIIGDGSQLTTRRIKLPIERNELFYPYFEMSSIELNDFSNIGSFSIISGPCQTNISIEMKPLTSIEGKLQTILRAGAWQGNLPKLEQSSFLINFYNQKNKRILSIQK